MCCEQQSDTVRCKAMKLFCGLCEHVTGFTTFAACTLVDVISKSVAGDDAFFIDLETRFCLRMLPLQFAEVSLICLAATGYLLIKRNDILQQIDQMLAQNLPLLLKFVRVPAFILCGNLLDVLFSTGSAPETQLDYLLEELLYSLAHTKKKDKAPFL